MQIHSPQSIDNYYRHFTDFQAALSCLQKHLGQLESLNVLEAGCGAKSNLDLKSCAVIGIDISQNQLDRNRSLQVKICADLHTYENEAWRHGVDLIVCWDVLEHLETPRRVLEKFREWTKPEVGRLVLALPNPQSLKGYVTKHSPFVLHKLFYRIVHGKPRNIRESLVPFRVSFCRRC
jgi:2-polyprenyl-3-methyl-5-hydroxy-6-metoxy-1,4-benzoquinol methylase